jgi:glycosyltransferase involved in cell wall biosynthesis
MTVLPSPDASVRRPLVLHLCAVEFTALALLQPQAQEMRRRGYDVRLACAPHGGAFDQRLEPFAPIDVRFPRSLRPLQIAAAMTKWSRLMFALRPDLVHLHTPSIALTTRLLPSRAVPTGTRVVYTVHGFAHVWDDMTVRDRLLERVERALAPRADLLLFQSREDLEHAQRLRYATRLGYLGNGVEDEWFHIPAPERTTGPLRLLFVGRLIREKGLPELLEALPHVPDVDLTVVGAQLPSDRDGVEREIRALAARPPLLGRVTFTGSQDRAQVRRRVAEAHAMVLPSNREGVPRCLIEGFAAGRPAVATDVRGCREVVQDGVTGFLVPPRDPVALAAALRRLAAVEQARFRVMSAAAHAFAVAHFRETVVFDRLADAYASLGVVP